MANENRSRISEFGEVFTAAREVTAMIDLVSNEAQRIDSRFLEPACGDGNFLIQVLQRKISVVSKIYSKNKLDYQRNIFMAVSSLYGIDILEDNVVRCRQRLGNFVVSEHDKKLSGVDSEKFEASIRYVVEKNILHGDALSLLHPTNGQQLVFSEWCMTGGSKVKRTEYSMNNILAYQPLEEDSLFSDLGDEVIIPKPTKTYPLTHFLEVADE